VGPNRVVGNSASSSPAGTGGSRGERSARGAISAWSYTRLQAQAGNERQGRQESGLMNGTLRPAAGLQQCTCCKAGSNLPALQATYSCRPQCDCLHKAVMLPQPPQCCRSHQCPATKWPGPAASLLPPPACCRPTHCSCSPVHGAVQAVGDVVVVLGGAHLAGLARLTGTPAVDEAGVGAKGLGKVAARLRDDAQLACREGASARQSGAGDGGHAGQGRQELMPSCHGWATDSCPDPHCTQHHQAHPHQQACTPTHPAPAQTYPNPTHRRRGSAGPARR